MVITKLEIQSQAQRKERPVNKDVQRVLDLQIWFILW